MSGLTVPKLGPPPLAYPRRQGTFVRFLEAEWGAVQQALPRERPVATRRSSVPEWIPDPVVAPPSVELEVEVTRSALHPLAGGAANWERRRLGRAVPRAAPRRGKRGIWVKKGVPTASGQPCTKPGERHSRPEQHLVGQQRSCLKDSAGPTRAPAVKKPLPKIRGGKGARCIDLRDRNVVQRTAHWLG